MVEINDTRMVRGWIPKSEEDTFQQRFELEISINRNVGKYKFALYRGAMGRIGGTGHRKLFEYEDECYSVLLDIVSDKKMTDYKCPCCYGDDVLRDHIWNEKEVDEAVDIQAVYDEMISSLRGGCSPM